jgi:hypothetical protein
MTLKTWLNMAGWILSVATITPAHGSQAVAVYQSKPTLVRALVRAVVWQWVTPKCTAVNL